MWSSSPSSPSFFPSAPAFFPFPRDLRFLFCWDLSRIKRFFFLCKWYNYSLDFTTPFNLVFLTHVHIYGHLPQLFLSVPLSLVKVQVLQQEWSHTEGEERGTTPVAFPHLFLASHRTWISAKDTIINYHNTICSPPLIKSASFSNCITNLYIYSYKNKNRTVWILWARPIRCPNPGLEQLSIFHHWENTAFPSEHSAIAETQAMGDF